MSNHSIKNIFYFDDDMDCIQEIISLLREKGEYDLKRAAHWEVIGELREIPFDLVIIDLNIHHSSTDESGKEVTNITYEGISWKRTGVEFLKRIRNGEYEDFGFSKEVPVIIASAVTDHFVKQEVRNLIISKYIEKPFTAEELQNAFREVL